MLPGRKTAAHRLERALHRARADGLDRAAPSRRPSRWTGASPTAPRTTAASGGAAGSAFRRHGRRPVRSEDGFVWLGLVEPTAEAIATVAAEFELPALAVEDAV